MAGISTSIGFPEADVLFDVAQGLPYQTPYNTILLSHAHMDHAAGLPYLISQKSMQRKPKPTIYMPEEAIEPLSQIMKLWEEIDEFQYEFDFKSVAKNEKILLKPSYFAKTFPTYHRIPSQGYTIFQTKRKLKTPYDEMAKKSPHEFARVKKENGLTDSEIYQEIEENLVSFTGDTRIEFLESDQANSSKLLVMEVTYWDEKKSVANAREWGHIHFDEFIDALPNIKAERIIIIHISARYTTNMIQEIIDKKVPEYLKPKLMIFNRPI